MNREIKFRGKRLKDGKWVYGQHFTSYHTTPDEARHIIREIVPEPEPEHDVDPATVGQYTGLKDRGGREIYEGDVVRFHFMCASTDIPKSGLYPTEEFIGIVTLDAYFHTCILSNKMEIHIENAVKYGEVIGNIHDNPDFTKTRER